MSVIGYKGLPYPGGFLPPRPSGDYTGDDIDVDTSPGIRQELIKGTRLYKKDVLGRWYFMPITIQYNGVDYELPNAVINLSQSKKIVKTDLVNRRGSVKELISIQDYEITIAAFIKTDDGTYPEEEISRMRDIWRVNESVKLISVITDLLFEKDDNIVIESIDWPATPGVEDGQAIAIKCSTDTPFELIIQ